MTNVVAFTPRSRPPEPAAPVPLAGLALRARLEEAAQTALDAADKIIAALDGIEGGADPQAAETASASSFKAMAAHAGQVILLREPAQPVPAPEAPQDEPPAAPAPATTAEVHQLFPPLPWGGAGNVVAAGGCVLFALVARK